tara:strand:- start:69685 stop:70413 length:729 start_codon:yes stop_codon:yes gene_type:complete
MLDVILKELAVFGITVQDGTYTMRGKSMQGKELIETLESKIKRNKKLLWAMWHEVCSELRSETENSMPADSLRNLFVPAIRSLYEICCYFDELDSNGVAKKLRESLDRDVESFSGLTMSRIIDYSIGIQWLTHLVRRDMYISHLVLRLQEPKKAVAVGVSGPWSRTDIPMRERVFQWSEIAEETAGRSRDKRHQRRYRMGLEQYKDPWPNEGFYWREIRNEPFSFSDSSANPYPHRNVLWRS